MRIIIPYPDSLKGGVEDVTRLFIKELVKLVDSVILILPKNQIPHYQKLIPPSDRLVYESFTWPLSTWQRYVHGVIRRISMITKKLGISYLYQVAEKLRLKITIDMRISYLAKRYSATHCLYVWHPLYRLVSNLKIPQGEIIYDLGWHFFLESNLDTDAEEREILYQNLKDYIEKIDILFAISKKTGRELNLLFPEYKFKVKVVPLAADMDSVGGKQDSAPAEEEEKTTPFFYYPASVANRKNHIVLFNAALKLATKGFQFKVVFTGWSTEGLISDEPTQASASEKCRLFYQEHKALLNNRIEALGYCEYEQVEKFYKDCTCVVLPSLYEGFGLPLIEALVRGTPVICSDTEAYREQVSLYNCADMVSFFSPDDVDGLAQLLEDFLIHPKRRFPVERTKETFSCWTWSDVAKAYVNLFQEVSQTTQDK